jgi:N-acetylmuramoyl-L-alanine amidase-like protein
MAGERAAVAAQGRRGTLAAVGRTTITRRRALALGVATGLGPLLARPLNAFGRVAPARLRGFGMDVRPGDFEGTTSRVLRAPARFDVLGVRGAGGRLELRVRRAGGQWSRWVPLAVHGDHAPDTGTGERASDPVWAGGCDELQLRAAGPLRAALHVHFVSVPAVGRRARRARVAAAKQGSPQPGTPPPIIPRSVWGGDSVPPRAAPEFGVVQMAFVHHTVTANDYTADQSASMVLGIAKYHRDTNGWNDIGYNFLVDRYGQVFEGRAGGVEQPVVGAHAQGYNDQSTGVALLGTFSGEQIPDPAMAAVAQLLGWKLSLHGVPCEGGLTVISGGGSLNRYRAGTPVSVQRISGHRDGDKTECPGNALYAQLPVLRQRAAALAGPVVARGQVSLRSAAAAVTYGADAVFTGTIVRPDSTAGAGDVVALQKRGSDGKWVTVGRATAGVDGSWVVRVPWRRGGEVRATAAGLSSKALEVDVTPVLSTRQAAKRVHAGSTVTLSGRVRPAAKVSIRLERQGSDGTFRRVRFVSARVSKTQWRAAVRLRRPGLYRLTARSGGGEGRAVYVRAVRSTGGASA